jgi:hypothetical protein
VSKEGGMSDEVPEPDGDLSEEHKAILEQMSEEELRVIDRELLARASNRLQKVAKLVASIMFKRPELAPELPDVFFAQRVTKLVKEGKLESQGALGYMRFCEVKLAYADRDQENT